jgi:hypothetical protein
MRLVGFGNLFIYLFIYFIHDIVYPYTTRGWKILDYSTCCRKHHSIYDLVVFPGNTSRIIENFQSSSCIIYENAIFNNTPMKFLKELILNRDSFTGQETTQEWESENKHSVKHRYTALVLIDM